MSDDELVNELRRLARSVDPVPDEVTAYARAALGWRRVDAELAELLADSRLETTSLARSAAGARMLSFRASDLELEVEVRATTIMGQLVPAAVAAVEVQRDDDEIVARGSADELGRFRLEFAGGGRVRLRVHREPPAPPVETSWFDA
jgi:hypothetical protein